MITSIPSNAHMRKWVTEKKKKAMLTWATADKPMCPREAPLYFLSLFFLSTFSEPTHEVCSKMKNGIFFFETLKWMELHMSFFCKLTHVFLLLTKKKERKLFVV